MAEAAYGNLGRVARGVLLLRLAAIALSVPALATGPAGEGPAFLALLGVLAGSLVPLLTWGRVERLVVRHPLFLGIDLVLAVVFLHATGADTPFVIATLGTATLGGLLYGIPGAVLCAVLLSAGYAVAAVSTLATPGAAGSASFALVIVALYPLLAAAGTALRRLLDTLDAVQRQAAAAVARLSAAEERTRLARDLHDSVGKSLHGIALMAHALQTTAADEAAKAQAGAIEDGARTAALEARSLIGGLRSIEDGRPLPDLVLDVATAWGREHAVAIEVDAAPTAEGSPRVRGEVLAVLGEALENIARHADASTARVTLLAEGDELVLEVRDDGRGIEDEALKRAREAGHWGVVGMRERAEACGGGVVIDSSAGRGTAVSLRVPSGLGQPDGEDTAGVHRPTWAATT